MKFVVVGTSHYGYEVTQTLLKDHPDSEIHLYERGDTMGFLSCGIQSYLEDIAPSLDSLHYATAESLAQQGVHIHVNSDVIGLDPEAKEITVKTPEGEKTQGYDKLFLSPGASPANLNVPGTDLDHVYFMRGREWAGKVKDRMQTAKKVVVIGAGYIGFEAAESYARAGIDTTLIEYQDHILPTYLDTELTDLLERVCEDHGLKVHTSEKVEKIVGENGQVSQVITDKGSYEADTIIIGLGIQPVTDWLRDAIQVDDRGFVAIDEYTQTSAKDVYAGGDATYIPYGPTGKKQSVALAPNARKQGVISAKNALENKYTQVQSNGTSVLPVFDYTIATTGVNDITCKACDGEVVGHYHEERIKPAFRGDDTIVHMKIFYDKDSHRILGGQLVSKADISDSINTLSAAISNSWTLEDLALADFYFQPAYDRAWHYLNVLAQQALGETFGSDKMLW